MKLYVFIGMWDGLPDRVEIFTSLEEAGKEYYEWTGYTFDQDVNKSIENDKEVFGEVNWEGSDIFTIDLDIITKKNSCILLTNKEFRSLKEFLEDYNVINIDMKDYLEGRDSLKSALKKLGFVMGR